MLIGAIVGENACLAGGDGFIVQALGDRLLIGTGDDSPGGQQIGQRVFGSVLPSSGVDRDPSFFSLSPAPAGFDALPIGGLVYWDFLPITIDGVTSNLFHWDSHGIVDFAPAEVETLSLFNVTNSVPATIDGSAKAIPGEHLGTLTNDFLSLHAHNFWALLGEGGDPLLGGGAEPAPGVYLAAMRLRLDGFVSTKPFFVALATSDTSSSSVNDDALPWIESNIDDLILRGDYNFDGMVDAADYELWRAQYGATSPQPVDIGDADGNGDGIVNLADYTVWRDHLMTTTATPANVIPTPEPNSVAVALALLGVFAHCRHTRLR